MPSRKRKSERGSLPAKQKLNIESTRRRSARGQSTNTLPTKKSPYFEHHSGDENEDVDEAEEGSEHEHETEYGSEHEPTTSLSGRRGDTIEKEDINPKKRMRNSTNPSSSSRAKKPKRSGEIFIPIRQPSPGDIEYQGHMIHPNTLDFLKGLLSTLVVAPTNLFA